MVEYARKRLLIFLLIFLSIIGLILLILTIIFSILYGIERSKIKSYENNSIEKNRTDDVCLTPYCIKIANYFLENIDQTTNPCENFYQFSCGKWIDSAQISDDDNYHGTFEIIEKKIISQIINLLTSPLSNETIGIDSIVNVRKLYSSCIDEDQIERENVDYILSLINYQLGEWPILQGSKWNSSSFQFISSLLKFNQLNRFLFFSIGTGIDEKNSSVHSIYLGQSSLVLSDRSYYFNETNITIAYREFIRDITLLLTNETTTTTTINQDIEDIFQFEKKIAQTYWTTAQRYSQIANRTTFANLSSLLNTTFDFTDYLRRVYLLGNIQLKTDDIIIIRELEVLQNLSKILQNESSRTIQNYMIWRWVLGHIEYMPKRFRMLKTRFNKIFQGINKEKARQIKCAENINYYMGLVVSKLYIHKYFDESSRQQSIEMISNVRKIFRQLINQTTWMDWQSKSRALEKIDSINQRIGYPDGLNNNRTYLDQKYRQYQFNSSYGKNILLINQLNLKENLGKLREPIDRKAWTYLAPTDLNAYYRSSYNDITFTAAILQSPFFDKDAPKYLNYGAIGMVIGHELTHGFDSRGRQYDKDGNRVLWWTNRTIEAFNQQKKCFIEQYSNYTIPQVNLNINGEQTQGENIADNGGLKQAFFAYHKWVENNRNVDKKLPGLSQYSPEQMFFINYAQIWCSKMTDQAAKRNVLTNLHSPDRFRVIGPTSNFAEFDRVFGCKPGQGNSRMNKCSVW